MSIEIAENLNKQTSFLIQPMLAQIPQNNLLVVKYSDLVSRNPNKVDALKRIVDFIGVNSTRERLECAFHLAESPVAHRTKSYYTSAVVYSLFPEIICPMWENVKNFSRLFGFGPYNGTAC